MKLSAVNALEICAFFAGMKNFEFDNIKYTELLAVYFLFYVFKNHSEWLKKAVEQWENINNNDMERTLQGLPYNSTLSISTYTLQDTYSSIELFR